MNDLGQALQPPGQAAVLAALRALSVEPRGGERPKPRTLLLAGPAGIGRRAVARWYAALRNCEAQLDDPCGRCRACSEMLPDADGQPTSLDYREVGPAATTKDGKQARRPQLRLEQLVARERSDEEPLGPWLAQAPRRRHRIGVIDHAELLTEEAANAFLKTLEEPPPHATIILIATGPDALMATVASRCTTLRLTPGTPTEGVRASLAPHPGLRLGRPEMWEAALAAPASTAARRAAIAALLRALDDDLASAFAAGDALLALWPVGDEEIPGLLREAWRADSADAYLLGDALLGRLEAAWGAYAPRPLALRDWVLGLRRARHLAGG
jgi:DNA polymerase III subunit delta'